MKRARLQQGSVVFDKRRRTWNFLWCENGHRRTKLIGSARTFPTKTSAWRAAEPFRRLVENPVSSNPVTTVDNIVAQYRSEKMPRRASTRRGLRGLAEQPHTPAMAELPAHRLASPSRGIVVTISDSFPKEQSSRAWAHPRSLGLRHVAR
jgi:hypothetical protein